MTTEYTLAVDDDTIVEPDAIEKRFATMDGADLAAACGFVVPRYVRTVWERGRYVEYLLAFSFYKPIPGSLRQAADLRRAASSIYRTDVLRQHGGWQTRTMAEDMDLTWTMYQEGQRVRFVPEAVCYPIEPHNLSFMRKQLRRWSHGFMQNVRLHWRGLLPISFLRSTISVALWESTVASVIYLGVLPISALFLHKPLILLVYVLDAHRPAGAGADRGHRAARVLAGGRQHSGVLAYCASSTVCLSSRPSGQELIVRRPLLVYEKGH